VNTNIAARNPAIQRYLETLEKSLAQTPGVVPEEGLADAEEFLLSEWTSALHSQSPCSDEELYNRFVERFGAPSEVAAAYAEAAAIGPESAAADSLPGNVAATRGSRRLLWTAVIAQMAMLALGIAWLVQWHVAVGKASSRDTSTANIAPLDLAQKDIAPAGRVVFARRGDMQRSQSIDPAAALDFPDCQNSAKQPDKFFALGCGGELIVEFTERVLMDGPGADLAIFEVGYPAELVDVFVSDDGNEWFSVGRTGLDSHTLDLSDHGLTGKRFRYVRIVDAKTKITTKEEFWGADIDAVIALHTAPSRGKASTAQASAKR
jgi:hypothetical protein